MKKLAATVGSLTIILLGTAIFQNGIVHDSASEASNIRPIGNEYYYTEEESTPKAVEKEVFVKTKISQTPKIEIDTDPASYTVLVNRSYPISKNYVPDDLIIPNVPYSFYGTYEKSYMRKKAGKALAKLFQGAYEEKGYTLKVVSAYRSYERQREIYETNLHTRGAENTNKVSANPGCSEHQTGLAIDISTPTVGYRIDSSFGKCDEGKWVKKNAWKYGFIIRYPKGKADITGYEYEPWHLRYVGKKLAKHLYKKKLTLEEYYHASSENNKIPKSEQILDTDIGAKKDKEIDTAPTPKATVEPTATPSPTVSSPSYTGQDSESTTSKKPKATKTPKTTKTPEETVAPDETKKPSKTMKPTETKKPSATKKPTETKKPADTPKPTASPKPQATTKPTPTDLPDDPINDTLTEPDDTAE